MSRTSQRTRSTAWDDLRRQVTTGKPIPTEMPLYLTLRGVKMWPEVFQQRRPPPYASTAHVRQLAKQAKTSAQKVLDPITVWWDGKGWACVDGHHRIAAYRQTGAGDIPVKVFEGSPEAALALSAKSNTRDKLPMSRSEKSNAAWHLVVATSLSKSAQADCSGVSERLVAHMRQVKAALQERGDKNLQDSSWEAARQRAAGMEERAEWDDDETEKRATVMATKIFKALGVNAGKKVEVFARAIEIYNQQLADGLAQHWRPELEGDEEG